MTHYVGSHPGEVCFAT